MRQGLGVAVRDFLGAGRDEVIRRVGVHTSGSARENPHHKEDEYDGQQIASSEVPPAPFEVDDPPGARRMWLRT
jgi:hypothetical protein